MTVDVIGLDFAYKAQQEQRIIFSGATASFSPGRFYALMGPSGSGKTTLFRILARELEPDAGKIVIAGKDLASIPPRELRASVMCRIFQDYLLIPFLSPLDNLLLAAEITTGRSGKEDKKRALELLDRVGLIEHAYRNVDLLSGGEQQRVAIARALMGSARILLADEPTGALDRDNTEHIALLLADLAHEEGLIVIAGTHDSQFAAHADAIVRISEHQLILES
ncbi:MULTISPECIES: ATP-binding cassette domain-containing protein [Actinotignum]|uniref:ATP-binding cassette domain-containing protein n=1 Tax=Actinotignum timonense TaxID=1870995 RepID=A0AAW9HF97_9ACTO|nr:MULTISPECIES: ATP-binding cassette domain-containing protein [Actinotignum]MDE1536583.1 ATP-binding cassette domain-containing protein [Actinotignum schaalii]MDE1558352.1 ATP-binding cassette domain-containing protein [Actinotignum schaalii]MDE1663144.1 ATP-binding cassette domain-containing protein [Actinotignum schaalii]MDK6374019.1 ATP-binding cassette domain-containing protein [Actinotignum timonense]MDK6419319.1 ATP-binding cassette domain-containing protein [Actinotignum timonense]